ncbi:MAG: hypothetical protein K9J37_13675 [Saprospiraceae bacterium]|nr:hypothetical protein [Saprospiraceae bacterium]MCF8250959.1 hypothetical protein [Saprospiraceae bacterium]MCF8281936.1 hypothetical protein [Bacteroidales bacterium]MCF8311923.1 hypothetical protein [Saprospiraceae bacterium]MCF8441931.1 hypothetical protein [Saprospiraceae bacterium]
MTNNPFTLTFTLKQHTPLIHFQHDQAGATLRATEVKPKLDRFIYEHYARIFPNETEHHLLLSRFKASEKNASLYKLSVRGGENPDKILLTSYLKREYQELLIENEVKYLHSMPYFAQEKEVNSLFREEGQRGAKSYYFVSENLVNITKWGLMTDSPIVIEVTSSKKDILLILKNAIPYLFALENFGTRQSKGFGCFSVQEPAVENMEALWRKVFPVVYRRQRQAGLQTLLQTIQSDYRLLKSGNSAKGAERYAKSKLFLFAVESNNPIRWEKRKIKQAIHQAPFVSNDGRRNNILLKADNNNSAISDSNGLQSWNDPEPPYEYAYLRAMLGLAEQYEFQTDHSQFKYVVPVKNHNGIERFRSPITFKVWNDTIYLLANPVPEQMLNQPFEFNLRMKENNRISDRNQYCRDNLMSPLNTPQNFNIRAFLEFALETGRERLNGYNPIQNLDRL